MWSVIVLVHLSSSPVILLAPFEVHVELCDGGRPISGCWLPSRVFVRVLGDEYMNTYFCSIEVRLVNCLFIFNPDFDTSIPSLPFLSIPREGSKINSWRIAAWPSCHLHQRLPLCYSLSFLCPTECGASHMHLCVSQSAHLSSLV